MDRITFFPGKSHIPDEAEPGNIALSSEGDQPRGTRYTGSFLDADSGVMLFARTLHYLWLGIWLFVVIPGLPELHEADAAALSSSQQFTLLAARHLMIYCCVFSVAGVAYVILRGLCAQKTS